jgi:hypothetical protein
MPRICIDQLSNHFLVNVHTNALWQWQRERKGRGDAMLVERRIARGLCWIGFGLCPHVGDRAIETAFADTLR